MRHSTKRILKVFTLSGILGVLGGLLTPPRSKSVSDQDADPTSPDLTPQPAHLDVDTPVASSEPTVPKQPAKRKPAAKAPVTSKTRTAAAAKPKSSSTA